VGYYIAAKPGPEKNGSKPGTIFQKPILEAKDFQRCGDISNLLKLMNPNGHVQKNHR
jgi:hypothetical protein